jgi:hypothetical protein
MSRPLKPFQFDTCYKVRFTVQFIQFLVVSSIDRCPEVDLRFSLLYSFRKYLGYFMTFGKLPAFISIVENYVSRFYKALAEIPGVARDSR